MCSRPPGFQMLSFREHDRFGHHCEGSEVEKMAKAFRSKDEVFPCMQGMVLLAFSVTGRVRRRVESFFSRG